MSIATCQSCKTFIDTDFDPESCMKDYFMCESCREQAQEAMFNHIVNIDNMVGIFRKSIRKREIERWRSKL